MNALATSLSAVALLFAVLLRIPVNSRRRLALMLPNFIGTAWAHYFAALAATAAVLGFIAGAPLAIAAGLAAMVAAADYVRLVTRRHELAFMLGLGPHWHEQLDPRAESRCVRHRWSWRAPPAPKARLTPDVAFATLRQGRVLLADLWEPSPKIPRSGAAIVYLHGSAWYLLDKDVGTRRFFSHLCAQGHVVVDVAYRLCPETDGVGMVHDAKRAVAWVKSHASDYGIDVKKVVLMGGSAGAHVALLAAYSQPNSELTPPELRAKDCSVAAVVSYYGVTDLWAYEAYAHRFVSAGWEHEILRSPPSQRSIRLWRRLFGRPLPVSQLPPTPPHRVLMRELAGGLPHEVPRRFDLLSPIHHVDRHCPPTLHFQAEHDNIVPPESGRSLERALHAKGVPAVNIQLPYTLHAFDLMFPPLFGPAAQAALYDVERFIGWATSKATLAADEDLLAGLQPGDRAAEARDAHLVNG